jgi:hypothetical protein
MRSNRRRRAPSVTALGVSDRQLPVDGAMRMPRTEESRRGCPDGCNAGMKRKPAGASRRRGSRAAAFLARETCGSPRQQHCRLAIPCSGSSSSGSGRLLPVEGVARPHGCGRDEPIAALPGARTAEAIVRGIEPDDPYPGPRGGDDDRPRGIGISPRHRRVRRWPERKSTRPVTGAARLRPARGAVSGRYRLAGARCSHGLSLWRRSRPPRRARWGARRAGVVRRERARASSPWRG